MFVLTVLLGVLSSFNVRWLVIDGSFLSISLQVSLVILGLAYVRARSVLQWLGVTCLFVGWCILSLWCYNYVVFGALLGLTELVALFFIFLIQVYLVFSVRVRASLVLWGWGLGAVYWVLWGLGCNWVWSDLYATNLCSENDLNSQFLILYSENISLLCLVGLLLVYVTVVIIAFIRIISSASEVTVLLDRQFFVNNVQNTSFSWFTDCVMMVRAWFK